MNAITIAQMSIPELNTTLNDIRSRDQSFQPFYDQVDPDPLMCESYLDFILPELFKWYNLNHNAEILDLVNYHIALQHRHVTNQLHSYDNDPDILPELLLDIQAELQHEDDLSDADTDQED